MFTDWLVFFVCLLAISIGWLLGRFPIKKLWQRFQKRAWRESYLNAMRLLLNEQSDQAIENFVKNWPVSIDNLDLHNALANMLRRKGETDRAILIHKNIIACNKLSQNQIEQATIELANDYMAAGLLDRAERLLINVLNSSKQVDERILEILQRVYQTEKEWQKAIVVAEQLLTRRSVKLSDATINSKQALEIAQYYCEIAQIALKEERFSDVKRALKNALTVNPNCARASFIQASMAVARKRYDVALQALKQIEQQDCRLLPECIELLSACLLPDEKAFCEQLTQWQQSYPSAALEKAIYDSLKKQQDTQAPIRLLSYVQARPTLQGVQYLLKQQEHEAVPSMLLLQDCLAQIMKGKAQYQCSECGFSGAQLHWLCPKCQHWNTIRRRRGVEGD